MIPMVLQTTIWNTAPFWAALIGMLLLKERLRKFEAVAMVLSFATILSINLMNSRTEAITPEDGDENDQRQ